MRLALRIFTVLLVSALSIGHWQLIPTSSQIQPEAAVIKSVSVEPLPLQVFCPGALVELGGESGVELGSISRVGEALISLNSTATDLLVAPPLASVQGVLAAAGDREQSTNLISMVQTQVIDRERATGLAAVYCQKPTSSGWLTNGASTVGNESILIASNPSSVEALVEIFIHTPSAVISDRFALAPGQEQLISTAQYANGEASFAVYFQTSGPEISMALQNRKTRGLTPIGVEVEGVSPNPGTDFVFAGLRSLTEGFENPQLRVFNPGEDPAEVVITVFAQDNIELYREIVGPGQFGNIELPITGGYQLASMTSNSPVLAAIMNPSTQDVLDFAWLQPAELFTSMSMALTNYQNTVLVANPSASALELSVESRNGNRLDVQSLVVPALSQIAIPTSAQGIRLSGSSEFAVALEVFDPNGYSIIHPRETANLGNDLSIRVN